MRRILLIFPFLVAGRLLAADLPITETPVGRLALPVLPDSLVISPDSAHLAFATNAGNLTLEDKGVFLKPPSGAAQESNLPKNIRATVRLYIDDKATPAFEVLTPARFSPDSQRVAFAGQRDGHWHIVVDNRTLVQDADAVPATPITFSPDSKHVAVIVQKKEQFLISVDEKPWPPIDAFAVGIPTFSPDGQHLGVVARVKASWVLYVDGQPLPPPPVPPAASGRPALSPATTRPGPATTPPRFDHFGEFRWRPDSSGLVFYGAFLNARWQLFSQDLAGGFTYISPGVEGIMKGSPILSPDTPHLAFAGTSRGKWSILTDATDSIAAEAPFDALRAESLAWLQTDTGPQLLYLAQRNKVWRIYLHGQSVGEETFTAITDASFTLSPDRRHYLFAGTRAGKALVVHDGKVVATHDEVGAATFAFSPDSQHFAYAARTGSQWFACVDGALPSSPAAYAGLAGQPIAFSPDSARIAFAALGSDKKWRLVLDKEGTSKPYDSFIKGAAPTWHADGTVTTLAIQKRVALRLVAR